MQQGAASDANLVARCRTGEAAAWSELVERFSRYVYAIATQGFRLPAHEAEDVFQDVFAKVYEHLNQLRNDEAIRPWIAQLTRRQCLNRMRGQHVELAEEDVETSAVDETLAKLEDAVAVHEALAELPEHCRQILDRFFARDESYRTIGEALDLPPGTVASRISRCLVKLREQLEGREPAPAASREQVPR